jgi:hypothetical protein
MKITRQKTHSAIAGLLLLLAPPAATADVVTDWNAVMQSTVAVNNVFLQTRNAAITQLAVFEAVNAITRDYEPYLGTVIASPGASPAAAAIAAAHRVLSTLYPNPAMVAVLDAQRAASLLSVTDGPAKQNGIAAGIAAADAMLALRSNDGSSAAVTYTPGTNPGDWQPTPPTFQAAFLPGWGLVQTFGINHGAQFRVSPPPLLNTGKYARDWDEVKEVGMRTSSSRPADRADVARMYTALLVVNLYHPIARQLSSVQGKNLSENARIFALLAMAGADGLISTMESKFHYNFWRPVTAIRSANLDGNAKTDSDPTWEPLIGTPPYPSYPSNHAGAAAASLAVLEHAFGKWGHSISLSSPAFPGVVLNYSTLADIAHDIDDARVFGGIHFRFDQEAGSRQGGQVGQYILQHELRPVH